MATEKKIYNATIDLLRILAILAVIVIHTTTRTLEASSFDIQKIPFTLFLNQIFRFAVPLFFLISGFVLELNYKKINYFDYFRKRASRILIPYFFWSSFYVVFLSYLKPLDKSLLYVFMTGTASYQLYFIPTLIIFYFIFPFLHSVYTVFSKKYILLCLGVIQFVLLTQDFYFHPLMVEQPIRVAFLNFFVFLLGMVASHKENEILSVVKKYKLPIVIVTLCMIFVVFYESYYIFLTTRKIGALYSQFRPSVYFYTLLLSSLLFSSFQTIHLQKIIKSLARLSFFVFFIHVAVLYFFWFQIGVYLLPKTQTSTFGKIEYDLLFIFFVTFVSFCIAAIVHKIPKLKVLTG